MAASLTGSCWWLKMEEPQGSCEEEKTGEMQMVELQLCFLKVDIKKAKKLQHRLQLKRKQASTATNRFISTVEL